MAAARYARLGLIGALACAIAAVCAPSSAIFASKWADTVSLGYTHGWLILGICIVLIWRSRRELAAQPAGASASAFALLAAAVLAWLVCYRGSIETLELPLVPAIFVLAVAAALGWSVARTVLFPAAYFCFAVPVWPPAPLQALTVHAIHGMLRLTGPPAVFAGDEVQIPNGRFVIEQGCSGLHFMIVGLAVAALYGELERDPWRVRIRQLALIAALALLANWVRVYTVIEAGYLTDMQSYLVRVSHYGFGWCVFAVALLVFFLLAPRLGSAAELAPGGAPAPPAQRQRLRPELLGCLAAIAVIAAPPAASALVRMRKPLPAIATAGARPAPPWHAVPLPSASAWSPRFPGADLLRRDDFADGAGRTIEVLTVAYRVQRQDAKLVGEDSSLVGNGLEPQAQQLARSSAGVFREAEVADRTQARSLIWWRYEVAGRALVAPVAELTWYGINALVWYPPAQLTALRTACNSDCEGARRTLRDFVASGGVR